MVELGELEKRHQDFEKRKIQLVVISNDNQETATETQRDFPHLKVVADTDQNMARALQTIHVGVGPGQTDTNAPTTFLVDGDGSVRWLFRPNRFLVRLSPDELLEAIDSFLEGNVSAKRGLKVGMQNELFTSPKRKRRVLPAPGARASGWYTVNI